MNYAKETLLTKSIKIINFKGNMLALENVISNPIGCLYIKQITIYLF